MPVIMMSGKTVAVGGFWESEEFEALTQATMICQQSYYGAELYHSAEELEACRQLAQAVGPRPWEDDWWSEVTDGHWHHILQPHAFDFLGRPRAALDEALH